jgi:hypothetical protein
LNDPAAAASAAARRRAEATGVSGSAICF